jgi:CYTH domain-containing protein
MSQEIERKYLVDPARLAADAGAALAAGERLRQGYVWAEERGSVRVRSAGHRAWLTIKGPSVGLTRSEFEYEIPVADADALLQGLCATSLDKTRHLWPRGGLTWEIDVFHGANAGLVLAEVELTHEGQDVGPLPGWILREVSLDARFFNAALARRPFGTWPEAERTEALRSTGG